MSRREQSGRYALIALGFMVCMGAGCGVIPGRAAAMTDRPVPIDLPARPLAQALDDLSGVTGVEIIYDGQLVRHRRSMTVSGTLTAFDALRIMLRGTGLTPRAITPDSFTLAPEASAGPGEVSIADRQYARYNSYLRSIQGSVERALCRFQDLRPAGYRSVLEFWIDPTGQIANPHLLTSTGSADLDRQMSEALARTAIGRPPEDLQQPIMILVLPPQSGLVLQCRTDGAAP